MLSRKVSEEERGFFAKPLALASRQAARQSMTTALTKNPGGAASSSWRNLTRASSLVIFDVAPSWRS
jgi:lipopolysaccharide biosynthesis protein